MNKIKSLVASFFGFNNPDAPLYWHRARLTAVHIVCGTCGLVEDENGCMQRLPRQTLLTKHGTCSGCDGNSFVFAHELARRLEKAIRGERLARVSDARELAREAIEAYYEQEPSESRRVN